MNVRFFRTTVHRHDGRGNQQWSHAGMADTIALNCEALGRSLTVGPDRMFSTSNTYGPFMRLYYSHSWSPEIEAAVIELDPLAATMSGRNVP
ncbi:hypothetical protein [Variovorax sp. WS11]|uniref:hypothetical protein n=1 Tax=Variovorax sp. WS11 TaxID=1105204 RepID=UPI0013DCF33A|nr:hypothetical protein [Variovorax sp. WS11]NDZ15715.1 hypothetical protein [Variovorax sp. WS11]